MTGMGHGRRGCSYSRVELSSLPYYYFRQEIQVPKWQAREREENLMIFPALSDASAFFGFGYYARLCCRDSEYEFPVAFIFITLLLSMTTAVVAGY
jgi:hypothetical protein